jgi:flagellar hook-length control protein FliK
MTSIPSNSVAPSKAPAAQFPVVGTGSDATSLVDSFDAVFRTTIKTEPSATTAEPPRNSRTDYDTREEPKSQPVDSSQPNGSVDDSKTEPLEHSTGAEAQADQADDDASREETSEQSETANASDDKQDETELAETKTAVSHVEITSDEQQEEAESEAGDTEALDVQVDEELEQQIIQVAVKPVEATAAADKPVETNVTAEQQQRGVVETENQPTTRNDGEVKETVDVSPIAKSKEDRAVDAEIDETQQVSDGEDAKWTSEKESASRSGKSRRVRVDSTSAKANAKTESAEQSANAKAEFQLETAASRDAIDRAPANRHAAPVNTHGEGEAPTTPVTSNESAATTTSKLPEHILGPPRSSAKQSGVRGMDATRLLNRVAKAFQSAQQRGGPLRIRLHPRELGSLKIELQVENGAMTAKLEVETTAARTALLDNLGGLRERLAEQGVRVEQFEVDVQSNAGNTDAEMGRDHEDEGDNRARQTGIELSRDESAGEHEDGSISNDPDGEERLNVVV